MFPTTPKRLDEPANPLADITCPKCGLDWTKHFVPEFCPDCGTRVAAVAGDGIEQTIQWMEFIGNPWKLAACSHCGLRLREEDWPQMPCCPRCYRSVATRPVRRGILAGLRRLLRKFQ